MEKSLSILVKFAALDRLTAPLRRMAGGSKAIAREVATTRKAILSLEQSAAKIGAYRDLQKQMETTGAKLGYARSRVAALRDAMAEAGAPTAKLGAQLLVAERAVDKLETAEGRQAQRLATMTREMGDAGVDVGRLADEEARLGREIEASNGKLKEQSDRLGRDAARQRRIDRASAMGDKLRARGVGMTAGGIAIGAPLVAAANDARDFASVMADIGINANASRAEIDRMAADILRMAPEVGQLPERLQAGLSTLVAAGMNADVAMKMIRGIGKTASAEKADVDDLANASFSAYNNLKVPIGEASRALEVMAYAGHKGGVELKDMAAGFPALTAAAQALGVKGTAGVADLAAALQIAKNGAKDADEASNNLLNLLNKINATDTASNFKKVGIDLQAEMKKAQAIGKSPIQAIIELTTRATKGDLAKLPTLFGDAQVQAALRPLVQGLAQYKDLRDEAANARGVVDRDYDTRKSTDPALREQTIDTKINAGKLRVGAIVDPAWLRLKQILGDVADRFIRFADAHPAVAKALLLTASAVATLLVLLGSLAIGLGMVAGPAMHGWTLLLKLKDLATLEPVLMRVAGAFRFLISPIQMLGRIALFALEGVAGAIGTLSLPVIAVIAVLTALLIGFSIFVYNNWNGIKAFFASIWQSFMTATSPLRASLSRLGAALGALGGAFLGFVARVVGPFVGAIARIGGAIANFFAPAVRWVGALVGPIALKAWVNAGAVIGGAIGGIVNKLKGLVDWITTGVGWLTRLFNAGAKTPATPPGPAAKVAALPGAVPKIAGKRATGGPVMGGKLYLVGERGPELFQAPGNGTIVPNHRLGRGLAMAGGAAAALAALPVAATPRISDPTPIAVRSSAPIVASGSSGLNSANAGRPVIQISGPIMIEVKGQPGQDEREVARAVADEFERRAIAASATRDSSMEDLD